ncbi:MAG: hypothetical protein V4469_04900 [Patescibacteria group bacterium]
MKSITIYHIDGVKDFATLVARARKEFPGIPFEKIKISFGIVSIHLEADTSKPRSKMRRVFKAQM